MTGSRLSVRKLLLLAFAGLVVTESSAQAESLDVERLAACLYENSTAADIDIFKKIVVAAIEEDSSLKGLTMLLSVALVSLATEKCGVTVSQLAEPAFATAATKYGEQMGMKIMSDAFAKMK